MHELGVTFYIIRDVKKVAEENNIPHVDRVILELGEVSTVIPDQLVDCWNWAAGKEDILRGCELAIEVQPAVTRCDDCGEEYSTVKYGKTCPHCGSENTYLLQGNQVSIKQIEIAEE